MRRWDTDGSAEADTRTTAFEYWCLCRGLFFIANLSWKLRVWWKR